MQDSVGAVTLCIICQSEDIPVSQSAEGGGCVEGGGWRVCGGCVREMNVRVSGLG